MLTDSHVTYARKLGAMNPAQNPFVNPSAMAALAKQAPHLVPHLMSIAQDPSCYALAMGSSGDFSPTGSATDPTGASSRNRGLGWNSGQTLRMPNLRHNILGFKATAVAAGVSGQIFNAKPAVPFKGQRIVLDPISIAAGGSIRGIQVGVRPQFAAVTDEPWDVYGPASYAGDIDLDVCPAAIDITSTVTSVANGTLYGAIIGEAIGQRYRALTSKLQVAGLGSTTVAAGATATITLAPQMDYTIRKLALVPGTGFSDGFVIKSILCGVQNQLMSTDPIPASTFTDLFPVFLDLDKINAATNLSLVVTNVTGGNAVFAGTTRGDVDPSQLAKWGQMQSAAYSSVQARF